MKETPKNLIYGLIDPRTLLIRYVGLSSSGMKRPRDHRLPSCPDTYCRRWVKILQRKGLRYEIVVLEVCKDAAALPEAERWWIAYGRACGWPLTNLTDGGGPSEEAIIDRRRRAAEYERLKNERGKYSPEEIEAFVERKKLRDATFRAELTAIAAARLKAEGKLDPWQELILWGKDPVAVEKLCFQLFDKHAGRTQLIVDVVIGARVTFDCAKYMHKKWLLKNESKV